MNELNNDLNQNQEEIINEISENNSQNYNQVNDEELINAYIGKNADKLKKGFSWNTLIFGFFYTLYRKMWLVGFCWLLIIVGIKTMPVLLDINLPSITQLFKNFDWYEWWQITLVLLPYVMNIIMAFLFKKIYSRIVAKKVKRIKNENSGKTTNELMQICNQKGGTTKLPVVILILICIGINIYGVYQSKKTLDSFEQKVAEDTAYSIISSVELAYAEAFLVTGKDVLIVEDIKKEYSGKGSAWNDDNTITPNRNLYDVVCNITVNSNNELVVKCDVNGKKINSEPLSMKLNNNSSNQNDNNSDNSQNDTQDNVIDKDEDNNGDEISYNEYKKFDVVTLSNGTKWVVIKDSDKNQDYVTLLSKEIFVLYFSDIPDAGNYFVEISEDEYYKFNKELYNTYETYDNCILKKILEERVVKNVPVNLKEVEGYKIRLITVDEILNLDNNWLYNEQADLYDYTGTKLVDYLNPILTMTRPKKTLSPRKASLYSIYTTVNPETHVSDTMIAPFAPYALYNSIKPVINVYKTELN